jgi:CubicO group peptidase (beta-lactamase class C family)
VPCRYAGHGEGDGRAGVRCGRTAKRATLPAGDLSSRNNKGVSCRPVDVRAVEVLLRELESADEFSGVVGIRQEGRDLLMRGYGYASRTWEIPMSLETRLDTASITKLFTAVATLQLVERERSSCTQRVATTNL